MTWLGGDCKNGWIRKVLRRTTKNVTSRMGGEKKAMARR